MTSDRIKRLCNRAFKKDMASFGAVSVLLMHLMGAVCTGITPPTYIAWDEKQYTLNHMVLDQSTGDIYLAGKDRLWKLDQNLNVLETIETGPVEDDPESCEAPFSSPSDSCIEKREGTAVHNYNQILVFDPDHKNLVTCGTAFQGTCQVRKTDRSSLKDSVTVYDSSRSYYLGSNTPGASTVAYIAPGPPNPEITNVLYVGTPYSGYFEQRNFVPAVSSRQLSPGPDMLEYAAFDTKNEYGTFIDLLNQEEREKYPIQYVTGFNDTGFSYFLAIQKERNGSGTITENYITKIIQICHSDTTYSSYIEIELECKSSSDNSKYNLVQSAVIGTPGVALTGKLGISSDKKVLIAAFSKAESFPKNEPEENMALCIYKMTDIRRKFLDNIEACYSGNDGNTLAKHFTEATCLDLGTGTINDEFCGIEDTDFLGFNHPIDGRMPASAQSIKEASGYRVTSIATEVINDDTVAFLGTSKGDLRKMLVYADSATEYNTISLSDSNSPILQDMSFDSSHQHLYAITEETIYRVRTAECENFTTCDECRAQGDPHCGWCSLENRCSRESECENGDDFQRWLSYRSWECLGVVTYHDRVTLTKQSSISMTIQSLPPGNKDQYKCVFNDQEVEVDFLTGSRSEVITCTTPSRSQLPRLEGNNDHINTTFAIKSVETGIKFIERPITFFDCSVHRACGTCSPSQWHCLWCLRDNFCTDFTTTCPTGSSQKIDSRNNCPRLIHNTAENEILIPIGHSMPIRINANNLPNIQSGEKGYECLIHLHTPPTRVPAIRRDENLLECQPYEYEYTSTTEEQKKVNLEVVWNDDYLIDDDFATEVTAYKCNLLGPDCSICVSVQNTAPKFGCNWCGTSCRYKDVCSAPSSDCPQPTLTKIWPLNGPVEGGTRITIEGTNLGYARNQIENAVTVGQGICSVKEYDISKRIICRTNALETSVTDLTGNIVVTIGDISITWPQPFVYKDPEIKNMEPKVGPISGGTEISIMGSKLNTGANIEVWLGPKGINTCKVNREKSSDEVLICKTNRVLSPLETERVTVEFDIQAQRTLNLMFRFQENPTISNISPLSVFQSGGRMITVEGAHFGVITKPLMYYYPHIQSEEKFRTNFSECTDVNPQGTRMLCPSPKILKKNSIAQRKRRETIDRSNYTVAFIMDDVETVRNMKNFFPNVASTFYVYPDPKIDRFDNGKRVYKGEALILDGKNLNLAANLDEFVVVIGNGLCVVQSLNADKLYCRPPEDQPAAVSPSGGISTALPMVKVTVGNLVFEPGVLEYQTASVYFPLPAIIGIIAGGSVLVLTIIVILIVCRRRSTLAERQFKKMKAQLDALESNVRNECKQAFAELQTEVSDVTSDLSMTGIPVWDYRQYNFKVLFPSHQDHPVLHMTMDMNGSLTKMGGFEQGLQQFNQLLNSKQFLVIFIRTLEAQRNFSIRDRAIVASLLMIVLMDKMEYATEILKALLNELIDRSVEKKHPKLMLRRTESVVEKFLTNWLSICMYAHIKKHTGKSLYLLYKAIKQQTEKGPVDAITSEARYSLSEDRLLREKIEPTSLNINLVAEGETEVVSCKMLDCDTITQAKEKALDAIYKNTPFSRRPPVYDVDLEWRSGRSGHLPLQDEDVTTEMIRGWKRINTLRHYHVPDGATMALAFKQSKNDYVRNVHGMVEITSGTSFGMKPIVTMEEGTKVWHLVKHDDGLYISRTQKVISEIFLTRLLTTKGTVQQYIDDMFLQILKVDHTLPAAIKYLYDFLDTAARRHNIVDSEVVHTWKSNSLPLRFWVNIIKNPEFVFDIHKSHIVDSCLSTIAQTFMDACSTSDHKLGKDSPTNKLLFARDIPRYRKWVERYYKEVQEAPPVTDHDMNIAMTEISMTHIADFNVSVALKELYRYATQYNFELLESLDDDPSAKKLHLAHKFEQVAATIDGSPLY